MSWLQAAVLLPFVLLVPGVALTAALFPPGTLPRGDRLAYAFVFSISAAALGGLALQVVAALKPASWLGLLLTITLAAGAIGLWRRPSIPTSRPSFPTPPRPAGVLWALAAIATLGLAIASIQIATEGVRDQERRQVFTSLWAAPGRPVSAPTGSAAQVTVGIWNHGGPNSFRLEARSRGRLLASLPISLEGNGAWEGTLPVPVTTRTRPLVIGLYQGAQPYRRIQLHIGEIR